tara:strand:- start:327 stop:587 length:261 start_codon:yes stop_codon:yes gene_type:complete
MGVLKVFEAIRRSLLVITWLPPTTFFGYSLIYFSGGLNIYPKEIELLLDETITLFVGFIVVPVIVHYFINWIFQFAKSGNNKNEQI